ncbi:MAG: rod shape-determining protein MreC [Desulfuromonadales bacterium]
MKAFGKKYLRIALVVLLLLMALMVYSYNLRHKESTSFFERSVLRLSAPFQKSLETSREYFLDLKDHYLWLVDTAYENDRLKKENHRLRGELLGYEEIRLANERLRGLLNFVEKVDLDAVPAQVIAEDSTSWFRTVVVDKGLEDGIGEGMAVVVPEGVVGRVIRSSEGESRVLLITDASSAASALVQRTRTRGVCRGRGERLVLEFALRQEDIQVEDRIITSGMGGVFPKGLLVGKVSAVERGEYGLFQNVVVEPVVDFSRLEEVLVLPGDR